MYRKTSENQPEFDNFTVPFGGHLNPKNRWVQLAEIIPWKIFEEKYAEQFSTETGAPAKSFRMALGALLIKEKLQITDEETVRQICENPYLQYLVGMEDFRSKDPFDPSMMVHFRKRINSEMIEEVNEVIHKEYVKKNEKRIKKLKKKKKLK